MIPDPAARVDPVQPAVYDDLDGALRDLKGAIAEADEEGFPRPSDMALANAERLLRQIYEILPRRIEVYPTPDAEIALDAPSERGSVILLCDSNRNFQSMTSARLS